MNTIPTTNLLRRTFLAVAALSAALASTAFAQQSANITKKDGTPLTTQTCTYTSLTVSANGALSLQGYDCGGTTTGTTGGTTTPGAPGSLTVSFPAGAVNLNDTTGTLLVTVSRTGGTTGKIDADYSFGGPSCGPAPGHSGQGHITFPDGNGTAQTFPFVTTATAGQCFFMIATGMLNGVATPAVLGGSDPAFPSINLPQSAPPATGGGSTSGCPTAASTTTFNLLDQGHASIQNSIFPAASGQIVAAQLPMLDLTTKKSASVSLQATTTSPNAQVEMWISPCPGSDPSTVPSQCHVLGGGQITQLYWLGAATGTAYDTSTCMAAQGTGTASPYYVNFRYTYSACPAGTLTCGYLGSWLYGGI